MFAPRCHEQLVALGGCLDEQRDFRRVEYAPRGVVDLWLLVSFKPLYGIRCEQSAPYRPRAAIARKTMEASEKTAGGCCCGARML